MRRRRGTSAIGPGAGPRAVVRQDHRVLGDTTPEADETFFVQLSNISSNGRLGDSQGLGVIVNDDGVGNARLPKESEARVGVPTAVTLTGTHPGRGRDLDTVDLRLRGDDDILVWLRFDEAANTLALIDPMTGSPGPAFAPGSPAELTAGAVALLLT